LRLYGNLDNDLVIVAAPVSDRVRDEFAGDKQCVCASLAADAGCIEDPREQASRGRDAAKRAQALGRFLIEQHR
jgi:hypothetical protein